MKQLSFPIELCGRKFPIPPYSQSPIQNAKIRGDRTRLCSWTILLICLLAPLGCDESVDPFVGDERPFTIWGFMDAGADTQRVRVVTIEERLGLDRSGPIDAVVTSTDLDTGERRTWHDSEITFEDGNVGHVFWAAFQAEFGHRYRLEITRSDGAVSSVEVTVPQAVEIHLDNGIQPTLYTVRIIGFPPNLHRIEVEYDVLTVPPANPWPPGSQSTAAHRLHVPISYDGEQMPLDDGWEIDINLRKDFTLIQEEFERNCLTENLMALRRMEFRFLAANEEWTPPGGTFDPEVLIEPGAFSNVENGFGFFGGGYTVSTQWLPPLDILQNVGFIFSQPCLNDTANIPECQLPPEPCFREE